MQQEGKLGKIIFNNPENGYTVAVFDTEEGSFRIAGSFAEPRTGTAYRLEGKFTVHPKYGEQFSFASYEEVMPEGADAILEFLSAGNIRGIGPVTAKAIVETFGDEALTVIEETPEKLLQVNGIGAKTLAKITESFDESREFANTSIELRELGIEMSEAVRVYKIYGKDSVRIVKENPYVLAEDIRGINFNRADAIAAKGKAEAEAIAAKGLAEAEAIDKKAEAMKKYGQAAMMEMIVKALPDMAAAIAEPLGQIDKVTIIDSCCFLYGLNCLCKDGRNIGSH